jgi:hypothetical protein
LLLAVTDISLFLEAQKASLLQNFLFFFPLKNESEEVKETLNFSLKNLIF